MKGIKIATIGIMLSCLVSYGQTAENIERAREAYRNYEFDRAEEFLQPAKVRKGRRTVSEPMTEEGTEMLDCVSRARNFMERVERIEILDSVTVPLEGFFKNYKLPQSAGTLSDGSELSVPNDNVEYVFTNEGGDYQIWSEPDSVGRMTLMESSRLTDGTWSTPQALPELNIDDRDAIYPFMMADGFTLYYTLDDPEGIGAYDIMVVTRDQTDGSFMQPQNLGMPYNSPADDYLLAIDEQNGVGWFATRRTETEDNDLVTIYLYKVNDLRRNYDPDDENLADLALLRDWRQTQDPEADYSELIATVQAIDPSIRKRPAEFHLPMDGGVIYEHFDDFNSNGAATLMKKYLSQKTKLEKLEDQLENMRRSYHDSPTESVARQIRQLETQVEKDRKDAKRQLSEVYRSERKSK